MTYSQRREKILSAMKIVDRLTVHQIVELTEASEATIRRDLARMESAGDIKRCWGGVGRSDTPDNLRKSSLQNHTISNSHEIIGKIAAEQVKDGELIFIGSGMTTLSMIPHIKSRNIHVITNGVPQLEALHEKGIQTLLLCGFFKEYSRSLVGKETVNSVVSMVVSSTSGSGSGSGSGSVSGSGSFSGSGSGFSSGSVPDSGCVFVPSVFSVRLAMFFSSLPQAHSPNSMTAASRIARILFIAVLLFFTRCPQPFTEPPQYSQQPDASGLVVAPHHGQVTA